MTRRTVRAVTTGLVVGLALVPCRAQDAGQGSGLGASPGTTSFINPAMGANPYANPYLNPFLNPYMTQMPLNMSKTDTALMFFSAQQARGGLLGAGTMGGAGGSAPPVRLARGAKGPGRGFDNTPAQAHLDSSGSLDHYFPAHGNRGGAGQYYDRGFNNSGVCRYYANRSARRDGR
jgi:hypothetical protein